MFSVWSLSIIISFLSLFNISPLKIPSSTVGAAKTRLVWQRITALRDSLPSALDHNDIDHLHALPSQNHNPKIIDFSHFSSLLEITITTACTQSPCPSSSHRMMSASPARSNHRSIRPTRKTLLHRLHVGPLLFSANMHAYIRVHIDRTWWMADFCPWTTA